MIFLYRKSNNTGRLGVFRSTGKALRKPAVWYNGASGALPAAKCRLAVGDVSGDGRSDVVLAQPTGRSSSRLTTCVADGSRFRPQTWWSGGWAYAGIQLAVAPSPGLVVTDDAEVLDATSLRYLRKVSADGATLTFAGQTGQLSRTQNGDVLFAMPSSTFPSGMCRTVTEVKKVSGQMVVATAEATLSDVVEQGEVAFSKHITAADLSQDGVVYPGVQFLGSGSFPSARPGPSTGITDGFGFSIDTTILGKVKMKGSVWLDPDAYVDYDLNLSGLHSASYTQTLTTSSELSLSFQQDYSAEEEVTIYEQTLGVITIMAGPWPVFVTPTFKVYVSAEGVVSAGVTAGVTLDTVTSLGISWDDDDGWSDPAIGFEKEYDWSPPQLFSGLTLTAAAGAGLSFDIYTVAGPEATLEAFLELAADPLADPWWTLDAGVGATIGFKVEKFGHVWLEKKYGLELFKARIDQAGSESSGGGSSEYQAPSIRGKIRDAGDSTPIDGAWVKLQRVGGGSAGTTRSAADGSYVFSGKTAGQYTVEASKAFYTDNSRSVTVVDGQITLNQDVSLVPIEDQGVRGRVLTSPGGAPVDQVWVSLWDVSAPSSDFPFGRFWDHDWADMDGAFEFLGVPAGQYRLHVDGSGYFPAHTDVTIVSGQIETNKNILSVPWEAQGVHGVVEDALTHQPIRGASVELHRGTGSPA
ncbi:MAG TPA: carboxypeptidase-like regulatory domain-containing protein, partial [Thermoleophilia bacterium]|nr:carboxypeptidase-like regulatory domain-containing protein [Thermoleophilia bacterium]